MTGCKDVWLKSSPAPGRVREEEEGSGEGSIGSSPGLWLFSWHSCPKYKWTYFSFLKSAVSPAETSRIGRGLLAEGRGGRRPREGVDHTLQPAPTLCSVLVKKSGGPIGLPPSRGRGGQVEGTSALECKL